MEAFPNSPYHSPLDACDRMLQNVLRAPYQGIHNKKLLSSVQMRKILRYDNAASFREFVKASGIPHIKINSRRILFDQAKVDRWLAARTFPVLKTNENSSCLGGVTK